MISRNFAILLISIAILVIAAPFASRDDWLGWVASFVAIGGALAILGQIVAAIIRRVNDWREE